MKKITSTKLIKTAIIFAFCVLTSIVLLTASYAEEPLYEMDEDGYYLVSSYEQLYEMAKTNYTDSKYRLTCDIHSSDSTNDYTIKIKGTHGADFTLDLNGYTLSRTCRSIDNALIHIAGGNAYIEDTSEGKTGRCEFGGYVIQVDDGGSLTINGGTYYVTDDASSTRCAIMVESGVVTILDGVFDSTAVSGASTICLFHQAFMYDVPVCIIKGGQFYSTIGLLEITTFGDYLKFGCFYPQAYVLGGEFYLTRNRVDHGIGFSYANNSWGDIIVAGGFHYDKSLNNDHRYIYGAAVKYSKLTVGDAGEAAYAEVTPPPLITVDGALDYDMRLMEKCTVTLIERYNGPNSIFSDYSPIKKMYADMIDYYLNGVAGRISVGARESKIPQMKLEGVADGAKLKWFVYETEYGGELDHSKWVEMTAYENNPRPVGMIERGADAKYVYVKCVAQNAAGDYYTDVILYEVSAEIREMSGEAAIAMNNVCLGNAVIAVVRNAPDYQKESDYVYAWKINGKIIGTEKRFEINDPGYLNGWLSCEITSRTIEGKLVTSSALITKKSNTEKPSRFAASYDASSKKLTLYGLSADQEYKLANVADSSEIIWINSIWPTGDTYTMTLTAQNIASFKDGVVYIHTRFKETSTQSAGSKVEVVSCLLAESVPLSSLIFENEVNGTIYIPFTGAGDTVKLYYAKDPVNANSWGNYSFRASYPVSIVSPTGSVTSGSSQNYVELKILAKGGTSLTASYYTNTEVVYKRVNIVVYDPESPTFGSANVASPLPDITIPEGTTYTPELPMIIPTPPDSVEFRWYLSISRQSGLETFTENEVASIDPITGEITALAKGSVYVSLMNGSYEMDKFLVSVTDMNGVIQTERIEFTERSVSILCGQSTFLRYNIFPANSNEERTWISSDPTVASVNADGKLTAKKVGTADITLTVGTCTIICKVTVVPGSMSAGLDPTACPKDESCPMSPFTDLSITDWYHDGIHFCVKQGLMNGTGNGSTFSPNMSMSRAMVVTVLYRLEGSPEVTGDVPFTDIKADWYRDAVKWAYQNSIVTGVSTSKFDPDGNVTREQIATILYRYAGYKGMDTSSSADITTFPDAAKTGSWAEAAVKWAVAEGLVTGAVKGGVTVLDPTGVASRAQVATILYRFCKI